MKSSKREIIEKLIDSARRFRLCGPSDDPDEQTAVMLGYRHLVIQFQRLVSPILPEEAAKRLNAINVEVDNLYSAFDASAELDALLPDIEASLDLLDHSGLTAGANVWIVNPALISTLERLESTRVDVESLLQMCREINSSYAHGNVLATALVMRAVLNHVPPVFGHDTFAQFLASVGKSLKESFDHLENGLRKIADYHTHRKIAASESYPTAAQVEPFKPQFELLLQQVEARLRLESMLKGSSAIN